MNINPTQANISPISISLFKTKTKPAKQNNIAAIYVSNASLISAANSLKWLSFSKTKRIL